LHRNLRNIQNINQKLIYNKIFNNDISLFDDEIQFIKNFSNINQKISLKKEIIKLVKESKNYKITEFIS
jgi:transposase-like protein